MSRQKPRPPFMERASHAVSEWAGSTAAFAMAAGLILAWLVSGPIFRFSNTWQLVINTTTTIVTFLMVFLIQRSQNKESRVTSLKLNELIAALQGASARLIDVDSLSETELEVLRRHYEELVKVESREGSLLESHSIEEAHDRYDAKSGESTSRRHGTTRGRQAARALGATRKT